MSHDHTHDHIIIPVEGRPASTPSGGTRRHVADEQDDCCGCSHEHSNAEHVPKEGGTSVVGFDNDHSHSNSSSVDSCCVDDTCASSKGKNKCISNKYNNDHSHAGANHCEDDADDCACCDHTKLLPTIATVSPPCCGSQSKSSSPSNLQQLQQRQQLQQKSQENQQKVINSAGGSIELTPILNVLHCDHCDVESGTIKHGNPVTSRLRIANLCCAGEEIIIHRCLDKHKGVANVAVNVLGRYILVKHCPAPCCAPVDVLMDVLNKERLGASIQEASEGSEEEEDSFPKYLRENIWRWVHAAILILLLISGSISQDVVNHKHNANYIASTSLYMIGTALGVVPVIKGSWVSIVIRKTIDIHVLILIAIIGAVLSHEYFDACLVVTLFILAEMVEEIALQKVRSAVKLGVGLGRPSKNVILPDGSKKQLDKVQLNDIICCRAGDSVPVDGVVSKGECVVNESALTGEALPISKAVGASMKSGTIVQNGYVEIKVTVPVSEGTYQKLQRTVDMLQTDRGKYAKFVDKFAVYWTPSVIITCILLVVIGGGITKKWSVFIHKALILLVLACPCAILLAAPLPSVCAIATATKWGVLIKGSSVIERIASINSIAVDKTGTMTKGLFKVINKVVLNKDLDYNPMELAAAIESKSSHPLANAIVSDCVGCIAESDVILPNAKKIKVIEGVGISGWVDLKKNDSRHVRIGNERMLKAFGGDIYLDNKTLSIVKNFMETYGKGSVIVMVAIEDHAGEDQLDLIMALSDEIREEASVFVSQMSNNFGMEVNMLTGDHEEVALAVGRSIGIPDECIRSRLLPNEKLQFIENMQEGLSKSSSIVSEKKKKNVLMVGDGINDAAALTKASIGVAMGEAGSAMAVDCADVIIMSDNLLRIPATITLSRYCNAVMLQNVIFAIGIKVLAVVLATTGYLPFWAAVITDIGALLVILANSTRLLCSDAYLASSLVSVYGLGPKEIIVEGADRDGK